MVKFSNFILENNDTDLASANVGNDEKLYNVAMKAHNSEDLKIAMLKLKTKFPDASKIKFDKVDWEEVFVDLNEKAIVKELVECDELSEELFNRVMNTFDIQIDENDTTDSILKKINIELV